MKALFLALLVVIAFGITAEQTAEYEEALKKLSKWKGGRLKTSEFSAMFGPIAREDMRVTGIPASVTLAQAAVESGWGKTAKASFKNLFGMKGAGDAGSVLVTTHERKKDGTKIIKKSYFAQYSSYLESIKAHSKYLLNSQNKKGIEGLRYGEALSHAFEPNLFAYLLREGGYATSAGYGRKLVSIMKSSNLYKWNLPPSEIDLSNVDEAQRKLIEQAKENLKNTDESEKRLQVLFSEEFVREVAAAKKDKKQPPKSKANYTTGGELTLALEKGETKTAEPKPEAEKDKEVLDNSEKTEKSEKSEKSEIYVVTGSNLNIRKGPSKSYSKVGSLNKGDEVTVTQTKNGFAKIGENKWASQDYLKLKENDEEDDASLNKLKME